MRLSPIFKRCLIASVGILAIGMLFKAVPARAVTGNTGGDGYVPIVYQGRFFNIFHHQVPSSDPNNPSYDISCIEPTGTDCATYPRYFSSTNGSSGRVGIGTPGTPDIYTSSHPQGIVEGSRLFYSGGQAGNIGIGCFDLNSAVNCGYFNLGTLANTVTARNEGVERIGNKIYSIGDDIKAHCLDITNPLAPVACANQPYTLNTGITAQMPTAVQGVISRLVIGTRIYYLVNYRLNSPSANARISCFDSTTNTRCAGWSSLELTAPSGSTVSFSRSLFEFPDPAGAVNTICSAQLVTNPVQCWNLTTLAIASAPPNLFSGISRPFPPTVREELRIGLKTYFAANVVTPNPFDGMAICYDFAVQARCAGFGTGGVKRWDGSDGGTNIGDTRDYGYTYNNGCVVGLGDAGVFWSFDPSTGLATGSLNCSPVVPTGLPNATPVIPKGLPNTSLGALGYAGLSLGTIALIGVGLYLRRRRQLQ